MNKLETEIPIAVRGARSFLNTLRTVLRKFLECHSAENFHKGYVSLKRPFWFWEALKNKQETLRVRSMMQGLEHSVYTGVKSCSNLSTRHS